MRRFELHSGPDQSLLSFLSAVAIPVLVGLGAALPCAMLLQRRTQPAELAEDERIQPAVGEGCGILPVAQMRVREQNAGGAAGQLSRRAVDQQVTDSAALRAAQNRARLRGAPSTGVGS